MHEPRLNVGYLTRLVLLLMLLPLGIGVAADLILDLTPFVTIATGIIFIPVASFFVTRASLSELNKVIQAVSPDDVNNGISVEQVNSDKVN
ncbi:hypothetical protein KFU94_11670 [Chloroflexi bacterium TSY]|nr:hypothetical protein [Chloroflexi bacterium TSY]